MYKSGQSDIFANEETAMARTKTRIDTRRAMLFINSFSFFALTFPGRTGPLPSRERVVGLRWGVPCIYTSVSIVNRSKFLSCQGDAHPEGMHVILHEKWGGGDLDYVV